MPNKENRQLISIGKSLGLTLPKPLVDYLGLKKDDPVTILYNDVLIIIPEKIFNRVMTQSGGEINQILNPDSADIILRLQPDLQAWIELKAQETHLPKEQLTIMLLREIMKESNDHDGGRK